MANEYGGQGANAFVQGFQGGYSFVDKAQQASDEAKLREQKIKKSVTDNKLLDIAYDDVAGPSQAEQEVSQLRQQVEQQGKTIQATNSSSMRKDLNEATLPTNGQDRSKMVETLKARFKTNPDVYKALGIQNANTMGILNANDQKDRNWITGTLEQNGVTPESQGVAPDSPEWQDIVNKAIDGYPAMKADGAIVDLVGLSIGTGSASMANPEYNARMEQNLTELWGRVTRSADNVETALSTEPGEPMPTQVEVEQNQMISPVTGEEIGMNGQGATVKETTPMTEDPITITNLDRLKEKEGFRAKAYKDTEGYWTIGYGHKINPDEQHLMDANLGEEEATQLLAKDAKAHEEKFTTKEPWTTELAPKVQEALNDMAYNMGPNWMDKFPSVRKALQEGDHEKAAEVIKGSKYAKQVGKRADENVSMILSGAEQVGTAPEEGVSTYSAEPEVVKAVEQEIVKSGANGQPLNDMRMRKVYSLLGKNYPKDPNEPTAKMKNFEQLRGVVGDDKAFDAVFGDKNSKTLSRIGKTIRDAQDAYANGDKEAGDILMEGARKQANKSTASKYDYDEARKANKELDKLDTLTPEQQSDYDANLEVVQGYEKTTGEQNTEAKLAMGKEAYSLSSQHTNAVEEAISGRGKPLDAKGEGDLREAQRLMEKTEGEKVKTRDSKVIESMQANQLGANEIASALNRFKDGDLQHVEKGVIDNLVQYVETKLPTTEGISEDRKATIEANIKEGTALGYLQATLIKAMSGTAASDAEVQRLTKVMQGNNWDQPEALKVALKEFYDVLGRQQKTYRNQLEVSPYSGYKLSMVDKVEDGTEKPKGAVTVDSTVPQGYKKQHNTKTGEYRLVEVK